MAWPKRIVHFTCDGQRRETATANDMAEESDGPLLPGSIQMLHRICIGRLLVIC